MAYEINSTFMEVKMDKIRLGNSELMVPRVGLGCMRISSLSEADIKRYVDTAMSEGYNFFDHADIYGDRQCEEKFGNAINLSGDEREKYVIQSKCGIVPGKRYDFSTDYIIQSVEGILSRLKTEYLDVLLLHRPDMLCEPEEVAAAFDKLYASGKVRHFGVSNEKPMQIELLKKYVKQDIIVNQLQLSITNSNMISNGINVNMNTNEAIDRDGSVLDYCRLKDITIQTWSPFQYGFFEGTFLNNDKFFELNQKINEIAQRYGVANTTIAIAWILRHPAKMQAIIGTTNCDRIKDCIKAASITLSRDEWYEIFMAAGNMLP